MFFYNIKEYNHCRNFEIHEMYKEADVNAHNPTGMIPLRFLSLGFYIFQICRYIKKFKSSPWFVTKTNLSSSFFASFSFHHLFGLILLIVIPMFLIYKQALLLGFSVLGIIYWFPTKAHSSCATFKDLVYSPLRFSNRHIVLWVRPYFVFVIISFKL